MRTVPHGPTIPLYMDKVRKGLVVLKNVETLKFKKKLANSQHKKRSTCPSCALPDQVPKIEKILQI